MHHRLVHRSPSDLSRTGLTAARLIIAVAMLLGTMTLGPQGAGAQSGSGFEYDEGGLTWSVDYERPAIGLTGGGGWWVGSANGSGTSLVGSAAG